MAVGSAADLGQSAGQAVDTGGTILPGLINSHAHLAWDGIHDLARQSMDDTPEISAYKSAGNMLISLRAGVTTVRDLGMNKTNFVAKQAVAQGIFPGPRLLICGEAIIQTGGHTYWCCREASGADEMRRAVREQVRGGADLIKIMACHDTLEFTDAELEAVIDESHRNGLPITAHATYDACIHRVAEFGIDCVEHGGSMTRRDDQAAAGQEDPDRDDLCAAGHAEQARGRAQVQHSRMEDRRAPEGGRRPHPLPGARSMRPRPACRSPSAPTPAARSSATT